MDDKWLTVDNLSFRYSSQFLFHNLSITVSVKQAIVGILGPSGIGKTTLLNLMAGFLSPSDGSIYFHGELVTGPSAERPVVFQDHNLFPWKSVSKNIELGLIAKKLPKAERKQKIEELLAAMGLENCAESYPRELSGGMQQRVGLARAMAVSPKCILMDEPFSALDDLTRQSVRSFFKHTLKLNSTNAVIVTHDADEARGLCDFLVLISPEGKVSSVATDSIDAKGLMLKLSNSQDFGNGIAAK